jgi:hypothetical protein
MRITRKAWVVVLLLAITGFAQAVEVIANKSVPLNALSVSSARAIFGMRQVKWPDGSLIRVFVLPDNHPVHGAFCKERLNIYPYQLRQSWDRLVYSGMAQAPEEVATETELIARVATTQGAVGYISKGNSHPGIRGIYVE